MEEMIDVSVSEAAVDTASVLLVIDSVSLREVVLVVCRLLVADVSAVMT